MRIEWKSPEDRARVWSGYRRSIEQRKTVQRDRYNVILLLGDGGPDAEEMQREQIAAAVGRSATRRWRRVRRTARKTRKPSRRSSTTPPFCPAGEA
jgi:hypothetical protein